MAKMINLIGQQFGELTVIKRAPNKNNRVMWMCKCKCGNEIEVRGDQLRGNITKSCGCLHKKTAAITGKNNFKDLTNKKFGKLTALKPIYNAEKKKYNWLCKCDCGNNVIVLGTSLTSGNTQSCGCIKSIGELNIQQLLNQNNINYIFQSRISINNQLYIYDFAIIENNKITKIIEFDGLQHTGKISGWFNEDRWKQLEQSDKIKNKYCLDNNIPLYRIPYEYRDKITLELLTDEKFRVTEEVDEAKKVDSN